MFGDDLADRQLINLTEKLDPHRMKSHEDSFLRGIQNNRTLSPKQRRWLLSILETHAVLEAPIGRRAPLDQPRPVPPPRETKLIGFPDPRDIRAVPPGRLGGIPVAATRSRSFDEALDEIDPCQGGLFSPGADDPYEPDF